MNNHNFVSWEITQMLPKFNPYQTTDMRALRWVILPKYYNFPSFTQYTEYLQLRYNSKDKDWKDAWTFEDVRLYLKEKGYILTQTIDTNDINYHCVDVFLFEDGYEGYLELSFRDSTFEKAREEAIKYCLNLINNESKT